MARAAEYIRQRADAMEAEMADPFRSYWRFETAADANTRYRAGVANGLGGPAGEMAAPWDLATSRAVAALLDKIAWMVGMDAELAGRVGVDEAIAVARAYLSDEEGPQ
jgi:methylmalonyl-CoA mutase N-terminal domain/subunit